MENESVANLEDHDEADHEESGTDSDAEDAFVEAYSSDVNSIGSDSS